MSIESVMPSNHLILCRPLLLLPSIFPSIRVFSNESILRIRWPKYWSFSFSISPSNEYSGLIFFRIDWLDLLAVQGTLKSLLQHHSSKASILWHSAFFMAQLCDMVTNSLAQPEGVFLLQLSYILHVFPQMPWKQRTGYLLHKGEKSPGPFNYLFKVLCMNHLFILGTLCSSAIKPRIGPGRIMRSQISVPLDRSHVPACRNSVFYEHRAGSHSATLGSPALLWVTLSDSHPSLCRHTD